MFSTGTNTFLRVEYPFPFGHLRMWVYSAQEDSFELHRSYNLARNILQTKFSTTHLVNASIGKQQRRVLIRNCRRARYVGMPTLRKEIEKRLSDFLWSPFTLVWCIRRHSMRVARERRRDEVGSMHTSQKREQQHTFLGNHPSDHWLTRRWSRGDCLFIFVAYFWRVFYALVYCFIAFT